MQYKIYFKNQDLYLHLIPIEVRIAQLWCVFIYSMFALSLPSVSIKHFKMYREYSVFIAVCDATVSRADSRGSPSCLDKEEYVIVS